MKLCLYRIALEIYAFNFNEYYKIENLEDLKYESNEKDTLKKLIE